MSVENKYTGAFWVTEILHVFIFTETEWYSIDTM